MSSKHGSRRRSGSGAFEQKNGKPIHAHVVGQTHSVTDEAFPLQGAKLVDMVVEMAVVEVVFLLRFDDAL